MAWRCHFVEVLSVYCFFCFLDFLSLNVSLKHTNELYASSQLMEATIHTIPSSSNNNCVLAMSVSPGLLLTPSVHLRRCVKLMRCHRLTQWVTIYWKFSFRSTTPFDHHPWKPIVCLQNGCVKFSQKKKNKTYCSRNCVRREQNSNREEGERKNENVRTHHLCISSVFAMKKTESSRWHIELHVFGYHEIVHVECEVSPRQIQIARPKRNKKHRVMRGGKEMNSATPNVTKLIWCCISARVECAWAQIHYIQCSMLIAHRSLLLHCPFSFSLRIPIIICVPVQLV